MATFYTVFFFCFFFTSQRQGIFVFKYNPYIYGDTQQAFPPLLTVDHLLFHILNTMWFFVNLILAKLNTSRETHHQFQNSTVRILNLSLMQRLNYIGPYMTQAQLCRIYFVEILAECVYSQIPLTLKNAIFSTIPNA